MSLDQPIKKKNLLDNNQSLNIILVILFIPVVGLLSILTVSEGTQDENVVYEKESRYHYIRVVDDNSIRTLFFTKGPGANRQSAIYLDSPDKHVFEYTQMVFASLAFVQKPQNILVIGLGGGIIPSTFAKHFPAAQIDIVEIDDEVVNVAKDFFNFNPSSLSNTIVSDGRVYVHQAKNKGLRYDIIVLDAFNGSYIPSHLTTKEFLQEVFSLLKNGGCVVSNIHHKNKLYEYQQRTYSEVATQNYTFKGNNAVIISTQDRDRLSRKEVKKKFSQIQNQFQLSFNLKSIANKLIKRPTWDTEGDILTDDYSPVNVLKSKKL
ncbi:MAG: fused MFS/spermidine synthase [Desulfobacula sp.]|nr:fused MFS/spermidine synthase [Desulfobacula sp.]